MVEQEEPGRDLAGLVVPLAGRLVATGDRWEPYRLLDPRRRGRGGGRSLFRPFAGGGAVGADGPFVWHGSAALVPVLVGCRAWRGIGRPVADARDFCRWLQVAGKPVRPHWREQDRPGAGRPAAASGVAYSPSVRAHCETVLRSFYDFHVEAGTGPAGQSVPAGPVAAGRAGACAPQPDGAVPPERSGLYRPVVPSRIPRNVPDEEFNEIFAALGSHRDRALVAFYVSTGARASELLSATRGGVDPGRQLITVVRKGTRAVQQLPASADAFVWLRLYQVEMDGMLPRGSGQPLWWTLRRPFRPLAYHAVHRMFERAGAAAGTARRCIRCGTRRPTGWPRIRLCR